MIRRPPISTLFPTRRSSDLRRLIHREPTILVGEPRPQGLEHPRLRLDSRLGDLDSSDRSARIETDGELEWAVLARSEEHTSELQSRLHLVCRHLLEKKKIHI